MSLRLPSHLWVERFFLKYFRLLSTIRGLGWIIHAVCALSWLRAQVKASYDRNARRDKFPKRSDQKFDAKPIVLVSAVKASRSLRYTRFARGSSAVSVAAARWSIQILGVPRRMHHSELLSRSSWVVDAQSATRTGRQRWVWLGSLHWVSRTQREDWWDGDASERQRMATGHPL